ncbi:hydroxymethylbilane synthase [Pacificimonas sp. WHA3]|uniref:Porphobilinogen deaminase n=1 Tax=Pacificimonas pallii TaxID=2827236 RepID=A0ABS6SAE7_9SPHN|nr:hydroxymethylbilane synthase [Pacificimonas pallii]MBV7255359.1 hydroxymethylbilane synthase [Pacificimonas pallii]
MEKKAFRIGTRGSPLALAQANMVAAAIGEPAELAIVRTAGDREQSRPLAAIGGKGVWTAELERQLLSGEIDMAVHSMKDVESERPGGLFIAAMLPRADVRDRLIGLPNLAALTAGATIGTSSPRRASQLLRRVPGLNIVPFRGNVATRLQRIADREADATLLAAAGLARLGQDDVGTAIETRDMLPAPGQGAIGIEVRADRARLRERLAQISHPETYDAVTAERAFARALGGSCHSPVAALAVIEGDRLVLRGEILSENGQIHRSGEASLSGVRSRHGVEAMGAALARDLLDGAPEALASLFTAAG